MPSNTSPAPGDKQRRQRRKRKAETLAETQARVLSTRKRTESGHLIQPLDALSELQVRDAIKSRAGSMRLMRLMKHLGLLVEEAESATGAGVLVVPQLLTIQQWERYWDEDYRRFLDECDAKLGKNP